MATTPTATFHPFPNLPTELRARIWELTVESRIVEVRVVYRQPDPANITRIEPSLRVADWRAKLPPPMRHLRSSTPPPAQLQTCHEARRHLTTHSDTSTEGRYEKAFSEIATRPYDGFDAVPDGDPERERYVWFNFDKDTMSIGDTDMHDFWAVARQVRRLRLERALSNEYFSRTESLLFARLFRNVSEVHLVCLEGIRSGYLVTEDTEFPCGPENVYFVDPEAMGGTIMNSVDLDAMVLRECEELYGPVDDD